MITVRAAGDRGHFDHGWLDTYHTFSFGAYQDPKHMGFRTLRVINDDRVIGGAGFGTHGHRDMEIITYVLEGALEHQDSMGNGSVMVPGDVQRMSAGTGITHSEYNHSPSDPVHFLQIWILPEMSGVAPGYEQHRFEAADRRGVLRLVASHDGADGSLKINQDSRLYVSLLESGEEVRHTYSKGRHGWLHVASGGVTLNGTALHTGDGAAISDESEVAIEGTERSEILLFDLN